MSIALMEPDGRHQPVQRRELTLTSTHLTPGALVRALADLYGTEPLLQYARGCETFGAISMERAVLDVLRER